MSAPLLLGAHGSHTAVARGTELSEQAAVAERHPFTGRRGQGSRQFTAGPSVRRAKVLHEQTARLLPVFLQHVREAGMCDAGNSTHYLGLGLVERLPEALQAASWPEHRLDAERVLLAQTARLLDPNGVEISLQVFIAAVRYECIRARSAGPPLVGTGDLLPGSWWTAVAMWNHGGTPTQPWRKDQLTLALRTWMHAVFG